MILNTSDRLNLFSFSVLHPDNCYGLRSLGSLGVSVIAPYLLAYFVILSLLGTHETLYDSLSIPLAGMTVLILVVTYAVLEPGYRLFKNAKRLTFSDLLSNHTFDPKNGGGGLRFATERICYGITDTSPYSTTIKVLVVAINLISLSGLSFSSLAQYFESVWR